MITVLYDGWPLVRRPCSPEGLHLAALLAHLPPQVEAVVALPELPPAWLARTTTHIRLTGDTVRDHLRWEQRVLPHLATQMRAQLLHMTSPNPPLFGRPISVVSPASYEFSPLPRRARLMTFPNRLREALALGGLARARGLFWPSDLPPLATTLPVYDLPPITLPPFGNSNAPTTPPQALDLPEAYILYHGPSDIQTLERLVEAWRWAAGPIGENYPLLLLGLGAVAQTHLTGMLTDPGLRKTIHILPETPLEFIPAVYQNASALFQPAPTPPWGGPLHQALAYGKPVVAVESAWASAIVGPAAYLLPENDARALGAALITVIVEAEVAERLSRAALERAAAWQANHFGQRLLVAYQRILSLPSS